jgi:hypothetical protein
MTKTREETIEDTLQRAADSARGGPALLIVFSEGRPMLHCEALGPVGSVAHVVGRELASGVRLNDPRLSREHARVRFDGKRWTIDDLGSTNGTYVDGVKVEGTASFASPRVFRMGGTVILPFAQLGAIPSCRHPPLADVVVGPTLARTLGAITTIAQSSESLLILGETGSGKEIAAAAFHAGGPHARGPLISVNCAAIPVALAERLLFGARRGAYSGATGTPQGTCRRRSTACSSSTRSASSRSIFKRSCSVSSRRRSSWFSAQPALERSTCAFASRRTVTFEPRSRPVDFVPTCSIASKSRP